MSDYEWNRTFFEKVVKINAGAADYGYRSAGPEGDRARLTEMETSALGPIRGASVLHLMCHIGAESTALAALGASVTAIDVNETAIRLARLRAEYLRLKIDFIQGDVRHAAGLVAGRKFDVVYMGLGLIGWISDLGALFRTVATCLRPGGRLVMFEIHPVAQTASAAEKSSDPRATEYGRHARDLPIRCEYRRSWAAERPSGEVDGFFLWKHSLGDVLTAVASAPLGIETFHEHAETTYRQFDDMTKGAGGTWSFVSPSIFPLTFTLVARRPYTRPSMAE